MLSAKRYLQNAPFVVLLIALVPLVVALADGAPRNLYWDGDHGIFLIDMHNAAKLEQAIGISSRFGWAHPGPLNYYLLAPFYWATGGGVQSLMLGTLLQNMICLFGSVAIIGRLFGRGLAGVFLVLLAWYLVAAVHPRVVWDVLLPFSTILPWVLALCLACAVVVEGFRWTPLFVLALCFLAQAHVSLWLPSAFLGVASVALSLVNRRPVPTDLIWLAAAAVLGFVLWLPPLLEWRNLNLIFAHFMKSEGAAHSWPEAFRAIAVLIGKSLTGKAIVYSNDATEEWHLVLGCLLLTGGGFATARAIKKGSRPAAALGGLALGSAAVFVFSLTRFTGPILHHSILFMTALGPVLIVLMLAAFRPVRGTVLAGLATVGCAVLIAANWQSFSENLTAAKMRNPSVRDLAEALAGELRQPPQPKTLFIDPAVWPVAVGAAAQAYRSGEPFRIHPAWAIIFGYQVTANQDGPAVRIVPGPDGKAAILPPS